MRNNEMLLVEHKSTIYDERLAQTSVAWQSYEVVVANARLV
jgi:hypothetical protein